MEEIDRLEKAGLKFSVGDENGQKSSSLAGNIIVISGNFSVSRDEIKELITAHGGKNSSSVSGKTTYLLAGEKPGPEKVKKAGALGIPVISEDEFRKLIVSGEESGQENMDNGEGNDSAPVQLTLF